MVFSSVNKTFLIISSTAFLQPLCTIGITVVFMYEREGRLYRCPLSSSQNIANSTLSKIFKGTDPEINPFAKLQLILRPS